MRPPPLAYRRPATLDAALQALREDEAATPIAGGQSLVVMLSLRVAATQSLVDIARLPELAQVEWRGEVLRIGAATRHAMIEDGLVPDPAQGLLARVAGGIAYRAVRNMGTIGGSLALADPAADWPVCLMALDATAVIAGERRVAMGDFIQGAYATALAPGEILEAIEIPLLPAEGRWGFAKLARKQGAFSDSLCVAVSRPGRPPRVVLGATGSGARLLPEVAAALSDAADAASLTAAIAQAVAAADPGADSYRLRCHAAIVARAVAQMRQP